MPSIEEALSQFRQQQGTSEIERLLLEFRNKEIETEPSKTEAVFGKVKDVVREVGEKEYAPPRERPERKPHERSAKVEGGRVRTESQEAFAEGMSRGLGVKFTPHEGEVHPSTGVEKIAGSVAGSLLGFTPWIAGGSMVAQPFTAGAGLSTTKAGQIANQMARGASSLGLAEGARQTMTGEQSPEQIAVSATIGAVTDPLFSQAVEWLTKRFGTNWRFGPKGEEMPIKDAYAELGLKSNATREQVKSAWRRLSKFNHPDYIRNHPEAGGSVDKFKKVVTAYERIASTWSKGKATPVATEPTPPTASTQTPVPLQEGAMVGATPPVGVPSVTPIVPEASEELISPLTSVVNTPSVGEVLEKVRGKAKGAVDLAKKTFSVTQPFNDLGAPETGRALERVFTTQEFNVTKAEDVLQKPLTKLKSELNISDTEMGELLFYAYDNTEFSALPAQQRAKLEPAVKLLRDYSEQMEVALKESGVIDEGFAEGLETRLRDEIQSIREDMIQAKSEEKIHRLAGKLKEAEDALDWAVKRSGELTYMPTPFRYWFSKAYEKRGVVASAKLMSQHFRQKSKVDMRALADDLLQKGIITRKQLDPRRIFADYSRTAGTKLAMADVYNSAKKEGLIVARNKKGAPTNWPSFPESVAPNLRNHVVHPTLYEYINKNLMSQGQINPEEQEIVHGLRHAWTGLKMFQFDNPIILGGYDLMQGAVLGTLRSLKAPSYLQKGFMSAWTHDEDYMTAFKEGAMPRPYRLPEAEAQARIERIISNETLPKAITAELKRLFGSGILPELYRLSHVAAWSLDHGVRMASYHYLRDKGYSPQEAAELTANAHGRYSNMPPSVRRKLNLPFFTPTFWTAMAKEQGKMIGGLAKTVTGKGEKKDKKYAEMAVAAVALLVGTDYMMTQAGFKRETFGRRYTRDGKIDGRPRELVVTLSTPYNIAMRYWDNLKRIPQSKEWSDKVTKAVPYSLHPGIHIIRELLSNREGGVEPIYNPYDVGLDQAKDVSLYLTRRIFRMTERFGETPTGKRRTEAVKSLKEEVGNLAHVLNVLGFIYDRAPAQQRVGWQVKEMEQELRRQLEFNQDATPERVQTWVGNVRKKIAELLATLGK